MYFISQFRLPETVLFLQSLHFTSITLARPRLSSTAVVVVVVVLLLIKLTQADLMF